MKTQSDSRYRIVALENLRAMCAHVSGVVHRYRIVKVSRSRVHVEYSNPDEYGNPQPIVAVYPCYPSPFRGDFENPRVVLDMLRVIGAGEDSEAWQAFIVLADCPSLWRGGPNAEGWRTERAILEEQTGAKVSALWDAHGCAIEGYRVCAIKGYRVTLRPGDPSLGGIESFDVLYAEHTGVNASAMSGGFDSSAVLNVLRNIRDRQEAAVKAGR